MPNARFAVVLGPLDRATADAWLDVFEDGDVVPDDAVDGAVEDRGDWAAAPGATSAIAAIAAARAGGN